jgi:hypothetical protein
MGVGPEGGLAQVREGPVGGMRGTERWEDRERVNGTGVPTPSGASETGVVLSTLAHVAASRGEESRYAHSPPRPRRWAP